MGIGEYPPEFNPRIHGPYNPARFYGKADVPLSQVKLGELGAWFGRRNKTPSAVVGAVSRGSWRWAMKWLLVKKTPVAALAQPIILLSGMYYLYHYDRHYYHRRTKYHW